jgi:asparagine synthase (glutamine-hydrolysing)
VESELRWMTDIMAHRGPDGDGVKLFDRAGLGHRRLAIIDPTPAGAQPMGYQDRWWITYNGELYNFRELRRELEQKGETFRTDCDTEVLLRMFVREGPGMLRRLNGIFGLAIWDDHEKRLFLARDRLGVKPLYYTQQPACFAFASELKALLPYIGTPKLDQTALLEYLTLLWVPDPKTAFEGIAKLPPGHYAWYHDGRLEVERYWDLHFDPETLSEREWSERVEVAVREAVVRQTVSDVPLGSFLSGGIDSSAVVAAMRHNGTRVTTYTVGASAEDLKHEIVPDDLRYARKAAEYLGVEYNERLLEQDMLELLPKTVWHLEEPVADPAAISTYLICAAARERMTVMLSGVGGDEIFAGYPRHLAYRISRLLDRMPDSGRRVSEAGVRRLARPGAPGRLRGPRRNLWKFMRAAGLTPEERYLSFCSYYANDELGELLAPDVQVNGHDPLAHHKGYFRSDMGGDELARLLYVDAKTFLPCLNLTYTDKMSMAASIEVRVPLLDDELVELAARIPSGLKLKGWRRKYIFKRSQEGTLPKEIIWRRKAGFGAPINAWLAGELGPMVGDLLSPETLRRRGLFTPEVVARYQRENAAGEADYGLRLYALLSLELWAQTFLDRTWSFN